MATASSKRDGHLFRDVRKIALLWLVPLCVALFNIELPWFTLVTSLIASAAEVVLATCTEHKPVRSANFYVPYLARLMILLSLQALASVWLLNGRADDTLRRDLLWSIAAAVPPVLGVDLEGAPFDVNADVASLAWAPKTMSVVLPCAEEREYALKTVKAVAATVPVEVLKEIVVVDDGSNPPLNTSVLTEDVQKLYNVRLLRHPRTEGLIRAKKTGGDAASGDVVVFFDCHVAPQPGWHEELLALLSQNWRRVVVPSITPLDIDTWSESSPHGLSKCYLTLDGDFKWYHGGDMYMVTISGGLLAMSKRWWRESGGYDENMFGWGGENIDQALRVWLCGGEIVEARHSRVAHMWRDGRAGTSARYTRVGNSGQNRARAVKAWYGDFAQKLESFSIGHYDAGNLSNLEAIRDRLKCRPFPWLLRRFKHIYEDAGFLPKKIFMIQDSSSSLCLKYHGSPGTSPSGQGDTQLLPCDEKDDRMFWALGNAGDGGRCCSGLRAWDTDQCLDHENDGVFHTAVCGIEGHNRGQHWKLQNGQLRRGKQCAEAVQMEGWRIKHVRCPWLKSSTWSFVNARVPLETMLYKRARDTNPATFANLDDVDWPSRLRRSPYAACLWQQCVRLVRENSTECLSASGNSLSLNWAECQLFLLSGKVKSFDRPELCLDANLSLAPCAQASLGAGQRICSAGSCFVAQAFRS